MQRYTQGETRREDHEELGRFLEDAACYLERWDICKANEALQKAGNKTKMMRGETGLTEPPAHYALLVDLIKDIQEHLDRPGRALAETAEEAGGGALPVRPRGPQGCRGDHG